MLNLGLIGFGYWGPNFARVVHQSDDCNLAFICDKDEQKKAKAEKAYPETNIISDYNSFLKDNKVDGVIVSTPLKTHYSIVKDLLEVGINVLCEKPLCYTSEELTSLQQAQKESGAIFMIGHTFLFNSAVEYIKTKSSSGDLGDIRYVYFNRTGLGPLRQDTNAMWDLAPHDVSIVLDLLGQAPKSVTAFGEIYLQENLHDVVFIIMEFPNNVIVKIHVSWLDPCKIRTMTVVGEKKMVVFDDVSLDKVKIYDKGVSYQPNTGNFGDFQLAVRDGGISIPNISYKEPLKEEINHFTESILNNRQPKTDFTNAASVVKVLEAAQKSLDNNNQKVML
tara:strand:- start:782 stop:1786 length:1005 start_codon:yes stop_codon:yes gene_type:complete